MNPDSSPEGDASPTNRPGYLQIAVARPLRRLFDYALPAELPVPPRGARVSAPFGTSKLVGIVMGHATPTDTQRTKPILDVLDTEPVLPEEQLNTAFWLANYYQHPIGEVCASLLPTAARRGREMRLPTELLYHCTPGTSQKEAKLAAGRAARQLALWEFIYKYPAGVSAEVLRDAGFARALQKALLDKGLIEATEALSLIHI